MEGTTLIWIIFIIFGLFLLEVLSGESIFKTIIAFIFIALLILVIDVFSFIGKFINKILFNDHHEHVHNCEFCGRAMKEDTMVLAMPTGEIIHASHYCMVGNWNKRKLEGKDVYAKNVPAQQLSQVLK